MMFENVEIVRYPNSRKKVIFQCDEDYFRDYAFYNLLSCEKVGHDVHIHFINVNQKFLERVLSLNLKIDLSISQENLITENINYYKLKSYYFCSRYFISDHLFEFDLIDDAYITDADIIFNEKIIFDQFDLAILYYPEFTNNLWKQTGANFLYVSKSKKDFLKKIIFEYQKKLKEINFDSISESMEKYQRANMYGLDQVSMSLAIQSENLNSPYFLNLGKIEKFIGNKDQFCKIWSLTAKKNEQTKHELKERFRKVF